MYCDCSHVIQLLGSNKPHYQIYATVGSDKKRRFLTESFNIPPENIYSSRNEDFAHHVMKATDGRGVDVILNFLTGNLLDESWRCIADRGVLLEIGKKDMLERNSLSMEPFCRNASYRALDMSHPSITRPMVASLLSRMFQMLKNGHIAPISPTTVFSFTDIPSAFRYMRGGSHMGKIVISDGATPDVQVSARAAPRVLSLREDVNYLLVGGLKGLCGSLAVYLARNGARSLTVVSRSGYGDEKSRAVLQDLEALGAHVDLVQGDVANLHDVRHAFDQSTKPIAGIIQGAMVLRASKSPPKASSFSADFSRTKPWRRWR